MNSSANSAGTNASVIDLELNTLEQPISADAQTDTVLDAVVVQAMYEEIPAESRFSSPLLKILGVSALSGAALSLVTPLMGWQTTKLLPTLGANDSDGASDVDGIDWVAPLPTESQPQVALAETSLPSFVTRPKGPTLSGQARLPLPSPLSTSPVAIGTPTFSASAPSRPAFDIQAFTSTNVTPSVAPKPVELDLLATSAPAVSTPAISTPASEAPVLTLPDIEALPVRQGRPVTVQANHRQNGELSTLPSVEPIQISALPASDTADAMSQTFDADKQMRGENLSASGEEIALEGNTLEDTALEDASLDEIYIETLVSEAPEITETALDGAAPVSIVLFPQESMAPADEVAADEAVADEAVADTAAFLVTADLSMENPDSSEYATEMSLSEMLASADPSSTFISADARISVEELVVDNSELLAIAIAGQGELVVPTETGDILIEAISVDEVFPETSHLGERALNIEQLEHRLTMRSGPDEQLIRTQINGDPVLLAVTHLSLEESLPPASTHQRLAQQLGKQTKAVTQ